MGGLLGGGGGKGYVDPPPSKIIGGGGPPPLPTPMVIACSDTLCCFALSFVFSSSSCFGIWGGLDM